MHHLWVNYAKAIGILLVVYGHVARGLYNAHVPMDPVVFGTVDALIYSFHMPLFFFLSGIFFLESLERRQSVGLLLSKVDTVVYPYVVWSLLQGLIEATLARWTTAQVTFSEVFSLLWQPRAQFWFLYALFFVFVVAVLAVKLLGRRHAAWLGVPALGLYFLRAEFSAPVLAYLANFLVFFWVGMHFRSVSAYATRHAGLLAIGLGLAAVCAQVALAKAGITGIGRDGLLLGNALVCIAFICSACMWLSQWKLRSLELIGALSMAIYLAHILAASGVRIVLSKVFHVDSLYLHTAAGMLAGVLLPILLVKLAPRLHGAALFNNPLPVEQMHLAAKRKLPKSR